MTKYKIQGMHALMDDMRAVARGDKPAPKDANRPSFESVEAIVRLLTPENRRLLATIRDREPRSIAELVAITGRAQPNLTRTLSKLEAAGLVRTKTEGKRKAITVRVKKLVVEIDPYSERDKFRVA